MKMKPCLFALLAGVWLIAVPFVGGQDTAVGRAIPSSKAARQTKTVRLLTVGNSFSQNATRYLGDLAKAGEHQLIHRRIVVGGASLQLHAEKAQKNQSDPSDKAGLYTNGRSLQQELLSDRWEIVTIQQASIKSHNLATYRPYAEQLRDIIQLHAPQARLMVHQTWAYRRDDPRFSAAEPAPGEPANQEAMYRSLTNAYETIAAELKANIIPVGNAFYLADSDSNWGYQVDTKFDRKTAQPPALPNQTHSLHVGWRWLVQKDGKKGLQIDGHHANTAGEYLGGCVFYEMIFDESPVGNPFVPSNLEPKYARFLQETAHQAATKSKKSPVTPGE